jgi:hypothetical protein
MKRETIVTNLMKIETYRKRLQAESGDDKETGDFSPRKFQIKERRRKSLPPFFCFFTPPLFISLTLPGHHLPGAVQCGT